MSTKIELIRSFGWFGNRKVWVKWKGIYAKLFTKDAQNYFRSGVSNWHCFGILETFTNKYPILSLTQSGCDIYVKRSFYYLVRQIPCSRRDSVNIICVHINICTYSVVISPTTPYHYHHSYLRHCYNTYFAAPPIELQPTCRWWPRFNYSGECWLAFNSVIITVRLLVVCYQHYFGCTPQRLPTTIQPLCDTEATSHYCWGAMLGSWEWWE